MASFPVFWSSTSLLLSTSISTSTTSIRRATTLSPPPNWGSSSSSSFSSLRCDFRASAAHLSLQPLNKNTLFNINSSSSSSSFIHPHLEQGSNGGEGGGGDGGDGSNNNGNNNNNNNHGWDSFGDSDGWWGSWNSNMDMGPFIFMLSLLGCCFLHSQLGSSAFAITDSSSSDNKKEDVVWEVRGGKWIKLLPDPSNDTFVIDESNPLSLSFGLNLWSQCRNLFMQLMLPEGYPNSVSSDYLEYSLWRGVQGIASQISGVLSTQALLYAVGLGKGAIPTAAAISWVLKDGIGYLSKILLSKYGRHFDVHPKGWRLFADLLENGAYGLELLTPAFPHLFVLIGAAAGASRSAASLIQAATRSCFYAGFAAQRNFAEGQVVYAFLLQNSLAWVNWIFQVIAKGEAQGMVSKSFGIMLGIALANCIGSSTPLAFASFTVITGIHMFCNLKSYQSIQLRTLNPYRASLVFSEYLLSGQVPPIKEVNDEEPLFPGLHLNNVGFASKEQPLVLSEDAKDAAAQIEHRLQLGSKLSEVINSKEDAVGLFDLYKNEAYILTEHKGQYCVVLKEGATAQDMLKSLFHVNYLYWLEKNVGIMPRSSAEDCRPGGKLQMSLDYVQREFNHVKHDGSLSGWVTEGLIARALPNRICLDFAASAPRN